MKWFSRGSGIDSLIAQRRYADAIDQIRKELRSHPDDAKLRFQLAETLAANGQIADATMTYEGLFYTCLNKGAYARAATVVKRVEALGRGTSALVAALSEKTQGARSKTARTSQEPAAQPEWSAAKPPEPEESEDRHLGTLFASMSIDELQAVMTRFFLVPCTPGDIILTEGEEGGSVYILAFGHAKVWRRDSSGQNKFVRELVEGDFFGEMGYLAHRARSATITASTNVELLEIPAEALDEISAKFPSVAEKLRDAVNARSS